jgi:hypothetical protein
LPLPAGDEAYEMTSVGSGTPRHGAMTNLDNGNDDGPEVIPCNKRVRLNKEEKAVTGSSTGVTPQAARTNANTVAQEAALRAALEEIRGYVCEDPCLPRLYLNLSRPKLTAKPAKVPPANLYIAESECEWSGSYSCREDPGKGAPVEPQEQEFLCSDPWTVIAEDSVAGATVTGPPPAGIIEQGQLMVQLLKNLRSSLTDALIMAILRLKCPPERCRNKVIRIQLWPPEANSTPPDAAGNITSKASQWYRVEARCSPD